jgi:2,3-bisphosphoglycerate-independent phosphoglycerate mutase
MKYVVLLIDGMADRNNKKIENKTPLMVAHIPGMRALCQKSIFGKVATIPKGMPPSSDVGNLGLLGYEPEVYHKGRGAFEALSLGLKLKVEDLVLRCNLITLSEGNDFNNKIILNSSGGNLSALEGIKLMEDLIQACPPPKGTLIVNEGYKHLLLLKNTIDFPDVLGAHAYLHKKIKAIPLEKHILDYYEKAHEFLDKHPVNEKRLLKGLPKANGICFWGQGRLTNLTAFQDKYRLKPAMVASSGLLLGMATALGFSKYPLEASRKNEFDKYLPLILKSLDSGCDFVYIHLEGVDDAGHGGDLEEKIRLLENIDKSLLIPLIETLNKKSMDYRLMVTTDHATPVALQNHTCEPVPYFIYDSKHILNGTKDFSEEMKEKDKLDFDHGTKLFEYFIKGQ